ncbi:MAG: hypothetical protein WCL51_15730 [Bacteroidota bacterium]
MKYRTILSTFIFITLFACSTSKHTTNNGIEQEKLNLTLIIDNAQKDSLNLSEDSLPSVVISDDAYQESGDTFQMRYPYDISFNIDSLKKLSYGVDTFDAVKAMFKLFPAPIDSNCLNYNEDNEVAYWICSKCPPKVYADNNDVYDTVSTDTIPYNFNFTSIVGNLKYKDKNGDSSCLLSFSTSREYPPCGRYTSGLLSMALFKKTNCWRLVSFNPFVEFEGSFAMAQAPESVVVLPNKDEFFVMHGGYANGPPYDDYTPISGSLYFYESNKCTMIIKILQAYKFNNGYDFGSKWHSDFKITETKHDTININVSTEGFIDKKNVWGYPQPLVDLDSNTFYKLPRKFNFHIIYNYNYVDNKVYPDKAILTVSYKTFFGKAITKTY